MKIIIKPTDIIKRCLWDEYEYYILEKDVNREKLVEEDKEFEINENDALVIGLLKCIETENLSHRLNQHIEYFIELRSTKKDKKYYLKKAQFIELIEKFIKKFPEYWEPDKVYTKTLKDLKKYIDYLLKAVEELSITIDSDHFGEYEFIEVNHVKKMIKRY